MLFNCFAYVIKPATDRFAPRRYLDLSDQIRHPIDYFQRQSEERKGCGNWL